MRILITGPQGRVGSYLCQALQEAGHDLIQWGRGKVDLTDADSLQEALDKLFCTGNTPDVDAVINCAAMSSLEGCLDDPVSAHQVNAMAAEILGAYCERTGTNFIHFSTDYVLDGRRPGKKIETDKCKPINVYGESKWEAELRLADICPSAVIARVSWVFGNAEKPAFPDSILTKALAGEPIAAINDKYSLPTSVKTITTAITHLLSHPEIRGIYHLSDSGEPVTWYDYALETIKIADRLGLALKQQHITPISLSTLEAFRDPRPLNTTMDNTRLSSLLPTPIPHWKNTLEEYLSSTYS